MTPTQQFRRSLAAIVILFALDGCAPTTEQINRNAMVAAFQSAYAKGMQDVADDKQCAAYGIGQGTPGYAGCRATLASQRRHPAP